MKPEPVLIEARQDDMRQRGLWRSETINDYLDDCVRTAPEREALVDHNSLTGKSTRLTWGELARRVDNIAQSLCDMGVMPGDVVSYQLPNWWEFTALYLSCARIGAVANPVMPIFRERELTFMLGLAESKVLIVPRNFRGHDYPGMIAGIRAQLPALEHVRIVDGQGDDAFETLADARQETRSGPAPGRRCGNPGALHIGDDRRTQGRDAYVQYAAVQPA